MSEDEALYSGDEDSPPPPQPTVPNQGGLNQRRQEDGAVPLTVDTGAAAPGGQEEQNGGESGSPTPTGDHHGDQMRFNDEDDGSMWQPRHRKVLVPKSRRSRTGTGTHFPFSPTSDRFEDGPRLNLDGNGAEQLIFHPIAAPSENQEEQITGEGGSTSRDDRDDGLDYGSEEGSPEQRSDDESDFPTLDDSENGLDHDREEGSPEQRSGDESDSPTHDDREYGLNYDREEDSPEQVNPFAFVSEVEGRRSDGEDGSPSPDGREEEPGSFFSSSPPESPESRSSSEQGAPSNDSQEGEGEGDVDGMDIDSPPHTPDRELEVYQGEGRPMPGDLNQHTETSMVEHAVKSPEFSPRTRKRIEYEESKGYLYADRKSIKWYEGNEDFVDVGRVRGRQYDKMINQPDLEKDMHRAIKKETELNIPFRRSPSSLKAAVLPPTTPLLTSGEEDEDTSMEDESSDSSPRHILSPTAPINPGEYKIDEDEEDKDFFAAFNKKKEDGEDVFSTSPPVSRAGTLIFPTVPAASTSGPIDLDVPMQDSTGDEDSLGRPSSRLDSHEDNGAVVVAQETPLPPSTDHPSYEGEQQEDIFRDEVLEAVTGMNHTDGLQLYHDLETRSTQTGTPAEVQESRTLKGLFREHQKIVNTEDLARDKKRRDGQDDTPQMPEIPDGLQEEADLPAAIRVKASVAMSHYYRWRFGQAYTRVDEIAREKVALGQQNGNLHDLYLRTWNDCVDQQEELDRKKEEIQNLEEAIEEEQKANKNLKAAITKMNIAAADMRNDWKQTKERAEKAEEQKQGAEDRANTAEAKAAEEKELADVERKRRGNPGVEAGAQTDSAQSVAAGTQTDSAHSAEAGTQTGDMVSPECQKKCEKLDEKCKDLLNKLKKSEERCEDLQKQLKTAKDLRDSTQDLLASTTKDLEAAYKKIEKLEEECKKLQDASDENKPESNVVSRSWKMIYPKRDDLYQARPLPWKINPSHREDLHRFIAEWVRQRRENDFKLTPQQVNDILGDGNTTFQALVDGIYQLGFRFRSERLSYKLAVGIEEWYIGQKCETPDAILFARNQCDNGNGVERLLRCYREARLQEQLKRNREHDNNVKDEEIAKLRQSVTDSENGPKYAQQILSEQDATIEKQRVHLKNLKHWETLGPKLYKISEQRKEQLDSMTKSGDSSEKQVLTMLQDENLILQGDLNKQKTELEACKKHGEELEAKLEACKKTQRPLSNEELEDELQKLRDDLAKCEEHRKLDDKESVAKQETNIALLEKLDELEKKDKDAKDLERKISELESKLQKSEEHRQELQTGLAGKSDLNDKSTQVSQADLEGKTSELESKLRECEKHRQELQAELAEKSDLKDKKAQESQADLERKISELRSQLETYKKHEQELQDKLAETSDLKDKEAQESQAALKSKISELESQLENCMKHRKEMEAELNGKPLSDATLLRREIEELQAKLKDAEARENVVRDAHARSMIQIQNSREKAAKLEEKIKEQKAEMKKLQAKSKEQEAEIGSLGKVIKDFEKAQKAQQAQQATDEAHKAEIAKLQAKISKLNATIMELEQAQKDAQQDQPDWQWLETQEKRKEEYKARGIRIEKQKTEIARLNATIEEFRQAQRDRETEFATQMKTTLDQHASAIRQLKQTQQSFGQLQPTEQPPKATEEETKRLQHETDRAIQAAFDEAKRYHSQVGDILKSSTESPLKSGPTILEEKNARIAALEAEVKKLQQQPPAAAPAFPTAAAPTNPFGAAPTNPFGAPSTPEKQWDSTPNGTPETFFTPQETMRKAVANILSNSNSKPNPFYRPRPAGEDPDIFRIPDFNPSATPAPLPTRTPRFNLTGSTPSPSPPRNLPSFDEARPEGWRERDAERIATASYLRVRTAYVAQRARRDGDVQNEENARESNLRAALGREPQYIPKEERKALWEKLAK